MVEVAKMLCKKTNQRTLLNTKKQTNIVCIFIAITYLILYDPQIMLQMETILNLTLTKYACSGLLCSRLL